MADFLDKSAFDDIIASLETLKTEVQTARNELDGVVDNLDELLNLESNITAVIGVFNDLPAINNVNGALAAINAVSAIVSDIQTAADNIQAIIDAPAAAISAGQSKEKAHEWADADEGVEVEPGEFSAKHYMLKAKDEADLAIQGIDFDAQVDDEADLPNPPPEGNLAKYYIKNADSGAIYDSSTTTWDIFPIGAGTNWGQIQGTLSNQTDLNTVLTDKASLTQDNTYSGANNFQGIVRSKNTASASTGTITLSEQAANLRWISFPNDMLGVTLNVHVHSLTTAVAGRGFIQRGFVFGVTGAGTFNMQSDEIRGADGIMSDQFEIGLLQVDGDDLIVPIRHSNDTVDNEYIVSVSVSGPETAVDFFIENISVDTPSAYSDPIDPQTNTFDIKTNFKNGASSDVAASSSNDLVRKGELDSSIAFLSNANPSIEDDNFAQIQTNIIAGTLLLQAISGSGGVASDVNAIVHFRSLGSLLSNSVSLGAQTEVATGVPTGTTGNDGKLTIFFDPAGEDIYIENRRGSSIAVSVTVLGNTS